MANLEQKTKEDLVRKLHRSAPILAGALAAMVVAAVAVWGYSEYQAKQEREAQAELYAYEKQIEDIEKKLYDEVLKEQTKGDDKKKDLDLRDIEKTPQSFEKNFAGVIGSFEQTIQKNFGTKASAVSTIFLADKYSEYGMQDKAKALLEKAKSATEDKVLSALLTMQRFAHTATPEQCQEQQSSLEEITNDASLKFLWAEAYLRKAACAWAAGKADEAEATIGKLKADFGESSAARKAEVLQRLIVLKSRENAQVSQ